MTRGFTNGDKCGCFVLINKWFFEVNLPYDQSNFTVNPGPTKKLPWRGRRIPPSPPTCRRGSLTASRLGSSTRARVRQSLESATSWPSSTRSCCDSSCRGRALNTFRRWSSPSSLRGRGEPWLGGSGFVPLTGAGCNNLFLFKVRDFLRVKVPNWQKLYFISIMYFPNWLTYEIEFK